jgi:uncharacterized membrane protein
MDSADATASQSGTHASTYNNTAMVHTTGFSYSDQGMDIGLCMYIYRCIYMHICIYI